MHAWLAEVRAPCPTVDIIIGAVPTVYFFAALCFFGLPGFSFSP